LQGLHLAVIEAYRGCDLLPIGLYIPFDRAWMAVKEFIEKDGALPESIAWIAAGDIPDDAFHDPAARFSDTA
jgi:hypothetical protein